MCDVVVGVHGESFGVGACGKCVIGRVGAFICVREVGFRGIVCVLVLCGGMPLESPEPSGRGAVRRVSYPRFSRRFQGA